MKRNTILFDINETVLNLSRLKPLFKEAFGDDSVMALWFALLLHSSTVCALTGRHSSFASLAGDVLNNVAARQGVTLSEATRERILATFANLTAHTDIKPALTKLRDNGYRTVAFSNSSLNLITQQIENAGLTHFFDDVISVQETGSFKPDPKVYQYVADQLKQPISLLRLVATHDWDTHGAMAAGMLSAYIDRAGTPYHPQFIQAPIMAKKMEDVVSAIIAADKGV